MFWFIAALVLAVVALVAFVAAAKNREPVAVIVGVIATIGAVFGLFTSVIYTQDPGEAKVLRSFTGEIVGQDLDAGMGFKAPWVDVVDFDIRNQVVSFIGDGTNSYNGQIPNGPQITTQDRDGATVNIDIVVQYSIQPDAVTGLYENYQSQENFVTQVIENDVRSLTREVPNRFSTEEVRSDRAQVGIAIEERLAAGWERKGIIVESVALQETRYSAEVTASFDQAQQARINVEREQANLEAAEIQAQQQVAQATAQAEANRILTESLSPQILQQRYLDTLSELAAEGNLVVVPEGFNGLVNVGQ